MKGLSRFMLLATTTLSLYHLAAAEPPFPESVTGTPEAILQGVKDVMMQLDSTTSYRGEKLALFAYRLFEGPESESSEFWGFGFLDAEFPATAKPIEERLFYHAVPPETANEFRRFTSVPFEEFLPRTKHLLVFLHEFKDDFGYFKIANRLWAIPEMRDSKLWYAEFKRQAMALE
ncbi:MAG: hypothetical protein M1829_006063 [Trizodia sp. TS-e1964]|nr:MAG: hypothetical protein M1829_006063 [Trizodia sp. TS-e1964]